MATIKKWKISKKGLDIIKKYCEFMPDPVCISEPADVGPMKFISGYYFTKSVFGTATLSTIPYSTQSALRICKTQLDRQLEQIKNELPKEIHQKFNQNQIDALGSFIQSHWITMDAQHNDIVKIIKSTQVFKAIKQDKFERAASKMASTRITIPSKIENLYKGIAPVGLIGTWGEMRETIEDLIDSVSDTDRARAESSLFSTEDKKESKLNKFIADMTSNSKW